MFAFRSLRWSVLALASGFAVPAAQADMITPNSIPSPPIFVSSANGTPLYGGNYVTTQYSGLGLNYPWQSAITRLDGISVWAPVSPPSDLPGQSSRGTIDYSHGSVFGTIVSPISLNPTTVSSLTVGILGSPSASVSVYGYGPNGRLLYLTPHIQSIAGVQDWTFTGPGIGSFFAAQSATNSQPWGVAEVSLTPAPTPEPAPEPTGLILAGLGALGMVTRLGWRRVRSIA